MSRSSPTTPAVRLSVSQLGSIPGLRTLGSTPFRHVLASVLLVVGAALVGMVLVRQASLGPGGQWAMDFGAYYSSMERMLGGGSLFSEAQLTGPIDALCRGCYLYPPAFAQVLSPVTMLPLGAAGVIWFTVQAAAIFSAVWIGAGVGGARRSLERALWCAVAAVYFLPVFDSVWKGNISGVIALTTVLVALGGAWAGVGSAVGALLKVVPGTLLPAALVMDRTARRTAILVIAVVVGVSFLLAPAAWLDYPTVIGNMLSGAVHYTNNLAPATVAVRLGWPGDVSSLIRGLTIILGLAGIAGSVWMARRPAGVPTAALLGAFALLLLPGALWYHYLVVLLPFAAMAWPRAKTPQRLALFGSAFLVTVGVVWLPIAMVGGILLGSISLYLIWPRSPQQPEAQPQVAS